MLAKPSPAARLLSLAAAASLCGIAHADEGMWQPPQLPGLAGALEQRGLALDPAKLATLTDWPLDAVVSLGFCTASFVSPDGLVVTNHHCGYGALQYNSTTQNNLIENGFLARAPGEELPADPTQRIYVTDEISDVTAKINAALKPGMNGYARYVAIDLAKKRQVQDCEQPGYRCDVYTFSGGYSYQLIRQREIRDVRLVYAPPLSIGKFGGDVDNWMWPRHTGDFSFLRAYVAKDGSAASYSKDNVPYHPKHWLTVNPDGVRTGDFVMVAGYPGRTDRYRLADELQNTIDWRYPTEIALFKDLLAMVDTASRARPEVGVKYADLVAGLNNAMKNYQGNLEGLARSNALAAKRAQEADLDRWLAAQADGGAAQAADVRALRALVASQLKLRDRNLVYRQLGFGGLFHSAYQIVRLAQEKQKPDLERESGYQKRDEIRVEGEARRLDRTMDPAVDQQMLVDTLQRYVKLPADQRLPALDRWLGGASDPAALTRKVAALYRGSRLTDTATRVHWLDATPERIAASNDTWLQLMRALMPDLLAYEHEQKAIAGDDARLRARYMTALVAFDAARGRPIYHDANNSLRVTYGTVGGYAPRDAVSYAAFTTVDGIVQKNTGAEPFNAPPAELAAIRAKAFDGYASPTLGTLPVNFLANLDITGGNSGSPTLDRNGKLVGLVFDGNWEGVSSGWLFNPAETRSIHVDVRYMLWVMHHLDHADNLLKEMQVGTAR
ncbi:S46 family peptidase [Burkholderia sp. FERM BP-3421]|uniref:S46 family peptidase n=1 Tax=Burkholderia sp. FERM BP-3421 TaxID=1494466 RepID=UPI0023610126|nr:S46 family peptidase [Burkholderia sp. FERM BP-3421]WDD93688.1 S46 family peptidase [Burkholderia sp. FERM BP-3421]